MIDQVVADSEDALRRLLLHYPKAGTIWIGFSGGLDSTALLWLASQTVRQTHPHGQLRALHVNHNLQPDAQSWVAHCKRIATQLGVDFKTVSVKPENASEAAAREARYRVFAELMSPEDLLLLAHHRNDQAETFLMRLFRGAGVQGLAAMPSERPLGSGRLLRPLLSISRHEVERIVAQAALDWIDDPSNQQINYLRNWVRSVLGPVLNQQWPGWDQKLALSAQSCAESAQLHLELARVDAGGHFANPLALTSALLSHPLRLSNLLYHWLRSEQVQPGSRSQLQEIAAQLRHSDSGCWPFGERVLHWYQQQLWLASAQVPVQSCRQVTLEPGTHSIGYGELQVESVAQGLPRGITVTLRSRRGGDQIKRAGGTQSVKKFMNANKVPPWLRDNWPLLEAEGEIIAIVGLWSSERWLQADGLALNWQR